MATNEDIIDRVILKRNDATLETAFENKINEEIIERVDKELPSLVRAYVKEQTKKIQTLTPKEVSDLVDKAIENIPPPKPIEKVIEKRIIVTPPKDTKKYAKESDLEDVEDQVKKLKKLIKEKDKEIAVQYIGTMVPNFNGQNGKFLSPVNGQLSWVEQQVSATTAPGGLDTQIQFNDVGTFGGDGGLTYNKTTDALTSGSFIKSGGLSTQFLKADGSIDSSTYLSANQTITLSGDVTGSGTVAITTAIATGVVTLAKMANMATSSLIYRRTAGTGVPEVNTLAQLKTDLLLTGTNSGDQTSIVGITGTKAQFDTAVTDGNFLYVGDITQYTDEMAQDAVGGMVDATLVYVDATPLLTRAALTGDVTASQASNATTIATGVVTLAKMADMATTSLIYRKTAGTGVPEVNTLATLKTDLGLTGTNSGDQTITLTGAVTGTGTGSFATTIATPGTLTVATSNSTATAHTHAITSSSAPGAAASLLATDSSGIIGSTGTRIVKGWFIDLTVTNVISGSITGNAATVTTNANLTGHITSTGNATVLGSFTKAQLDAAVSDGNVLFVGDITQYTDEMAQDAVGAMVDGTLLYTDVTPLLSVVSAPILTTARTIGGVSFNGSANIVPQTIESANEATDTTCFPLFITASGTQQLQPKNNTGLTYNSNTNALSATTFTGAFSGNATTATSLQNARTIGGVSFDGTANIVPQTIQSVNEATDTTCFLLFISASGTQSLQPLNNTALKFNSNTGDLGSTSFTGAGTGLTGTASSLTAGTVTTNANLTGGVTSVGNAATVITNANLTGDVTSVGNATTLTNAPVIAKVLTGYVSGAGTVAATDSILQAIQKLNGNNATNANLTGPITSVGNATSIAAQTGTGTTFVMSASPTFTGTVTIPTPFTLGATSVTSTGTQLNYLNAATGTTGTASTNVVFSASPTLTGSPIAPTQTALDNSTKIATTAYTDVAVSQHQPILMIQVFS